jgi:hypothetical protein
VPAGRAEIAAGLDAQGVDPRAAIENSWGLDVRDELGRPVTREKVLADLKSAAVKRAADNSFTSALPRARAVLSALELLADAAVFHFTVPRFRLPAALAALPGGRPKLEAVLLLVVCSAVLTVSSCCRAGTTVPIYRSRQSRPEVLRC